MKKYSTFIALGLAVVCGALAVWLTSQWLQAQAADGQAVKETVPMTRVVVAAQDIQIGTLLGEDNLTLADWPQSNVPKGAFDNIEAVAGRIAVTRLPAGGPLQAAELAEPGSGAGLVALIPPGRRAMSIKVDEVSGVAGFILPNTYVDVISVNNKSNRDAREAKTILKKIKVLAIAQETTTDKGKAKIVKSVTLELLPKEAETLALHSILGSIHLILRNPLEQEEAAPEVAPVIAPRPRVAKAKPQPKVVQTAPVAPKPTGPASYSVEVIKGSNDPEKIKFKSVNSDERL
ncbi:MAG: Flp pilus assembly protein CpaB [Desulfuromonadales bacterium]|nr:Flp pilus assembly protein CpaB [Desulfuromonadales bacterium]